MVVDDLDILGSSVAPPEADAPLLVDADAVGARPVASEFLEPVSRRYPEIIERLGSIQEEQLSQRGALDALIELGTRRRCQTRSVSLSANDRNTRAKHNATRYERQTLYGQIDGQPQKMPVGSASISASSGPMLALVPMFS